MKLPRENVYTCQVCHKFFVTVDVDDGVTPFMTECKEAGCKGGAHSSFYPTGPRPPRIPAPTYEWYKPDAAEMASLSGGVRQHVEQGGLLLRARTDREPVYHRAKAV